MPYAWIRQIVEGFRQKHGFDPANPADFDALVTFVMAQNPTDASEMDPDVLSMITAVCATGIGGQQELPDKQVIDELLAILRFYVHDLEQRKRKVVEYVIAYGCRKKKWPSYPSEPRFLPETPWLRSMDGLKRLILAPVRDADTWLKNHIRGYPGYGYPQISRNPPRTDDDLRSDAFLLAKRFCNPDSQINAKSIQIKADKDVAEITLGSFKTLDPLKGGSKYVFIIHGNLMHMTWQDPNSTGFNIINIDDGSRLVVKAGYSETTIMVNGTIVAKLRPYFQATLSGLQEIDILECTCGHQECQRRHRLDSWDPGIQDIDLVSFIASAAKGPGKKETRHKIVSGALQEGMFFTLLSWGF